MRLHEDKIILSDCDGCLLNWNSAFSVWMMEKGYTLINPNAYDISERYGLQPGYGDQLVRHFNDVEKAIGSLPAWSDSVAFVRKLHFVHGYRFAVISAVSDAPDTAVLRRENLYQIFGPECFHSLVCLKIGADKTDALRPYKHSRKFWIEDNLKNAMVGHQIGLRSLLIDAAYNEAANLPFPRFCSWTQIYDHVIQNEGK